MLNRYKKFPVTRVTIEPEPEFNHVLPKKSVAAIMTLGFKPRSTSTLPVLVEENAIKPKIS